MLTTVPADTKVSDGLASIMTMNMANTALPCVTGATVDLYPETSHLLAAMTAAIQGSTDYARVEFYISSWDAATDAFFTALVEAAGRGVEVRLLMDQLGSRNYPGRRRMEDRLTTAGVQWRRMMPIEPLHGRWRRPDLRNHRKLMVVDGEHRRHRLGAASGLRDRLVHRDRRATDAGPLLRGQAGPGAGWRRKRLPAGAVRARVPLRTQPADVHRPDPPGHAQGRHHQPLLRARRVAPRRDHHRGLPRRRRRAVRRRTGRPVPGLPRPAVLLPGSPRGRRDDLALPCAHPSCTRSTSRSTTPLG